MHIREGVKLGKTIFEQPWEEENCLNYVHAHTPLTGVLFFHDKSHIQFQCSSPIPFIYMPTSSNKVIFNKNHKSYFSFI